MKEYHESDSLSSSEYTDARVRKMPDGRTRATTWAPRRAYYVLRYLKRRLAPNKPQALSNKQIQTAIGFGSEGEVSQIMRWLSGEAPTLGRWAYDYLTAPQAYRFIKRERTPSGGYLITLLATPKPIDQGAPDAPEVQQLTFWDDPSMIPSAPRPDATEGGSFSHDPFGAADRPHQERQNARSQGDHPKESHEDSDQEEESARAPLSEQTARRSAIYSGGAYAAEARSTQGENLRRTGAGDFCGDDRGNDRTRFARGSGSTDAFASVPHAADFGGMGAMDVAHASTAQRNGSDGTPDSRQRQIANQAYNAMLQRLLAEPGMDRPLARRIAAKPVGTLAEFEADVTIAQSFAQSPFYFTVAKWRDGQRVLAPEVCHERPRSAAPARTRRGSHPNQSAPTADPAAPLDIAALVAEWERTEPLGPIAMRVPRRRGRAYAD